MRKFSYTFSLLFYIVSILFLGTYPKIRILPFRIDLSLLYHFVAFFLLMVFLLDYFKNKVFSFLIALFIAIIVEILQKLIPTGRAASQYDILFDGTGIFLALIIGYRAKEYVFKILSTFFGTGLSPIAPGTLASGIFIFGFYFLNNYRRLYAWQVFLITLPVSIYVSQKAEDFWGKDPSRCVIDEVAGIALPMVFLKGGFVNYLIVFLLFRLFDILKPLGIKKFDEIKGGFGIVLDDLVASVYTIFTYKLLKIVFLQFGIGF